MPLSFSGNTSSSATSEEQPLPMKVDYFTLVPKVSGVVNVYKITIDDAQICMIPLNTAVTSGQMWEGTTQIILLATEKIKVQTSVSLDYSFTINNLEP